MLEKTALKALLPLDLERGSHGFAMALGFAVVRCVVRVRP
jgi:hypothetical protein